MTCVWPIDASLHSPFSIGNTGVQWLSVEPPAVRLRRQCRRVWRQRMTPAVASAAVAASFQGAILHLRWWPLRLSLIWIFRHGSYLKKLLRQSEEKATIKPTLLLLVLRPRSFSLTLIHTFSWADSGIVTSLSLIPTILFRLPFLYLSLDKAFASAANRTLSWFVCLFVFFKKLTHLCQS